MPSNLWWIWVILAAICIVAEIFTAGFFISLFGIGALVAGILSLLGLGAGWQWAALVIVSGVLFAISRRFAERFTKKQPPGIGADRFIGKKGIVLEEINNPQNTGRIRIDKEEWRADSDSEAIIPLGKMVEVTRVDGTHMVVKLVKEEH